MLDQSSIATTFFKFAFHLEGSMNRDRELKYTEIHNTSMPIILNNIIILEQKLMNIMRHKKIIDVSVYDEMWCQLTSNEYVG